MTTYTGTSADETIAPANVSSTVSHPFLTSLNGPDLLLPLPKDELHGVVDLVTGEVVGAR